MTTSPPRLPGLTGVVLGVLLILLGPAAALGAPGERSDPVGVWPLTPTPAVVRGFEPPDTPYGPGHRGVDVAGSVGQPVRASLAGTVSFAGSLAGRGVVVVSHGATRTTYEPVQATVSVGDTVTSGGRLGTLQLGGSHCLPRACLHWGWIDGDTYLDPLRLVGAGPVRLLPLDGRPSPSLVPRTWVPPTTPYADLVSLLRLLRISVGAS